jgi:hypothetical protein
MFLNISKYHRIFAFFCFLALSIYLYFYRKAIEYGSRRSTKRISRFEIYNQRSGFLEHASVYTIYKNIEAFTPTGTFIIATVLDSTKLHYLRSLRESLDPIIAISAAILVGRPSEITFIEEEFSQPNTRLSFVTSREPASEESWFPNNLLRNVARNLTTTCDYFLLIDIDLGISPGFVERLEIFLKNISNTNSKDLLLVPVFEKESSTEINSFQDLEENYENGKVQMFHAWCTEWCYSFYNFPKWFDKTKQNPNRTEVGYEIKYKLSFEPYYLGRLDSAPFYDTRFQGYGYNKVEQCYEAALQKFTFKVLTSIWLVHDGIKNETEGAGANQQKFNQYLFNMKKRELKQKYLL